MKKQNKGITLIALVITIIILLILAGIALNSILGENGILNKVNLASEKYQKAAIKEELETEILNIELGKIQKGQEFKREDLRELGKIGAVIEDTRNTSNRAI